MLSSFVIVHQPPSTSQTFARHQSGQSAQKFDLEQTLHRTRHAGNPPSRA
jgi:hypothetical protein